MITLQRRARLPLRSLARPRALFQAAWSSRPKRLRIGVDDPARLALAWCGQTASAWAGFRRPGGPIVLATGEFSANTSQLLLPEPAI